MALWPIWHCRNAYIPSEVVVCFSLFYGTLPTIERPDRNTEYLCHSWCSCRGLDRCTPGRYGDNRGTGLPWRSGPSCSSCRSVRHQKACGGGQQWGVLTGMNKSMFCHLMTYTARVYGVVGWWRTQPLWLEITGSCVSEVLTCVQGSWCSPLPLDRCTAHR